MPGRYKKGWSALHQKVFTLYVEGSGIRKIAQELELPYAKIYQMTQQKAFLDHHTQVVTDSVGTARKLLENKLVEAASKIANIMRCGKPEDKIRFEAAKEILYQCGMKPIDVVETRTREYTPQEIESSLTVIREVQAIEEKLAQASSTFIVDKTTPTTLSIDTSDVIAEVASEVSDVTQESTSDVTAPDDTSDDISISDSTTTHILTEQVAPTPIADNV